jgi:hypothetical protein
LALTLGVALGCSAVHAQPLPSTSVVRVAKSVTEVNESLDKIDSALAQKDTKAADGAVHDLSYAVFSLGFGTLDPALQKRIVDTRMKAARAGCRVVSFEVWGFDGKTYQGRQKLFVETAEDKACNVDRDLQNSQADMAARDLVKLREVLAKPEFQSDPVLKDYLERFAAPQMASLLSRLAIMRSGNMEYEYAWIQEAIAKNDVTSVNVHAPNFKNFYYSLRNDGFDTSTLRISKNYKDPLAESVSLDEALKGVNQAMLQVKALAAKEKARQAAYAKKWATLMRGDKARIYAKSGVPTRYEGCLPDYQPEPALKSSWWLYYERQDAYWLWEITYRFDRQGRLTGTERIRSFTPQ